MDDEYGPEWNYRAACKHTGYIIIQARTGNMDPPAKS